MDCASSERESRREEEGTEDDEGIAGEMEEVEPPSIFPEVGRLLGLALAALLLLTVVVVLDFGWTVVEVLLFLSVVVIVDSSFSLFFPEVVDET